MRFRRGARIQTLNWFVSKYCFCTVCKRGVRIQSHVNTEVRNNARSVPKLKPATLYAKIAALDTELSELQYQRQQLIDSASVPPLVGQYIANKKSGGTAFSGKPETQSMHDYYALVDATGAFIRYVSKHEVAAYRDRIHLGKKVARLNRAIARCEKRINQYKGKLPIAEPIESATIAISNSLSESQNYSGDENETEMPDSGFYTVESDDSWIVFEAA